MSEVGVLILLSYGVLALVAVLAIIHVHRRINLSRLKEESINRIDSYYVPAYIHCQIWPIAPEYRLCVIETDGNLRNGIEALYKGTWIPVEYYCVGCNAQGRAIIPTWESIAFLCSWSTIGLTELISTFHVDYVKYMKSNHKKINPELQLTIISKYNIIKDMYAPTKEAITLSEMIWKL